MCFQTTSGERNGAPRLLTLAVELVVRAELDLLVAVVGFTSPITGGLLNMEESHGKMAQLLQDDNSYPYNCVGRRTFSEALRWMRTVSSSGAMGIINQVVNSFPSNDL